MLPYHVEYYCYRIQPVRWRRMGGWFFNPQGQAFLDYDSAERAADSLIWQYHAARVVDGYGTVVYATAGAPA